MSYTKTNWQNTPSTQTPISAANLNHMEQGIYDATSTAESAQSGVDGLDPRMDLVEQRLDNLIPQGTPTQGNAELIDIRVGANGVTYPTAGDAVRGQVTQIKSALSNIQDGKDITLEWTLGANLYRKSNGNLGRATGVSAYASYPSNLYTAQVKRSDIGAIYAKTGYDCSVYLTSLYGATAPVVWYSEEQSYIRLPQDVGDYYIWVSIHKLDNTEITEQEAEENVLAVPVIEARFDEDEARITKLETEVVNQWSGKSWYAYGTSITANNGQSGRNTYVKYLAEMSGMVATNKGIGGGGIGDLGAYSQGQVYDAICNITDGKLDADIITLETGANDTDADVPLGTIYDTGRTTLAGCLNDCLRYLQANTDAQIAVTVSPATTEEPNATNKYYEWALMVEQICKINRVHFLNNDNNMGYAKISDATKGPLYVINDMTIKIHETDLGSYIMAENLWYQLRNIPIFRTSLPS